jgi:hypothetical protein
MRYSFSKSKRFDYNYGKNSSKQFIYNLPEVRDNRATSLGYGDRSNFTKVEDYKKAPFTDTRNNINMKNRTFSPSYSFGTSWKYYEKVVKNFLFNNILKIIPNKGKIIDIDVPGPAKYDLLKTNGFGQESIKYSINPESKNFTNILYLLLGKSDNSKKINNVDPGPGHYETSDNPNGKYMISSLRSTSSNLWSCSKTSRFKSPSKE